MSGLNYERTPAWEAKRAQKCQMGLCLEEVGFVEYAIGTKLLEWWKANKHRWPKVALMARQYRGTPANSVGVERVFSSLQLVGFTPTSTSTRMVTM